MDKAKAKKALQDAADLLEEGGWIQGCFHQPEGCCMIGALRLTMGGRRHLTIPGYVEAPDDDDYFKVLKILMDSMNNVTLAHWNDAPKRKKEEVIAALRKAADSC